MIGEAETAAAPPDHKVSWLSRRWVVLSIASLGLALAIALRMSMNGRGVAFVAMVPGLIGLVFLARYYRRYSKTALQSERLRVRHLAEPMIVQTLVLVTVIVIALGSVRQSIGMIAMMVAMNVGMTLISFGVPRRIGRDRVCASCGYTFMEAGTPERCPECGHDWLNLGSGTKVGRRVSHRGLLIAGIFIAVLPLALMFASLRFNVRSRLPTSMLVTEAVNTRMSGFEVWQELAKRTLTPEQHRRLIVSVLDRMRDSEMSWSADKRWVDSQILAGKMPADLLPRYYEDSFRLQLIAPTKARVGESITVRLGAPYQVFEVGVPAPAFYFDGFSVSGEPFAEHWSRARIELDHHDMIFIGEPDNANNAARKLPTTTITPDKPGLIAVRVRGVIYYQLGPPPAPSTQTSRVGPDGDWVPPPSAVWSKAIELETTIEVRP